MRIAKDYMFAVLVTVVTFVSASDNGSLVTQCPASCSCLGNVVDCSKGSLTTVPPAIPHWVETL